MGASAKPPSRVARRQPRRRFFLELVLLLLLAAGLLAPRLLDARAALLWTRYLAAQDPATTHPSERAQKTARFAALAVDKGAPLPWAAEAARHGLDVGRQLEVENPALAAGVYGEVRAALDRACASRLRGLGLAGLAAEAHGLEDATRARLATPAAPR